LNTPSVPGLEGYDAEYVDSLKAQATPIARPNIVP